MICRSCNKDKAESEFYAYKKRGILYHKAYCKECVKRLKRTRYKEDGEYQQKLKDGALKWAHSEEGKRKRKLIQQARVKTKEFKEYHYWWELNTEKGRASVKRRMAKWLKTDSGKFYSQRKHARRRSKINIKATLTRQEWQGILELYNYSCAYCGSKENIEQDHIIPLARNGHHIKENVVPACRKCNNKKGAEIWKPILF